MAVENPGPKCTKPRLGRGFGHSILENLPVAVLLVHAALLLAGLLVLLLAALLLVGALAALLLLLLVLPMLLTLLPALLLLLVAILIHGVAPVASRAPSAAGTATPCHAH